MKKMLAAALAASVLFVGAASAASPASASSAALRASAPDPAAAIAHAKAVMALKLKDPDSARYIDLIVRDKVVCGWVNAKNSFGGYVGYKPFFVMGANAEIRDDDDADQIFNNHYQFAEGWYRCHPEARTKLGDALVNLPNINIDRKCAKLSKFLNEAAGGGRCHEVEVNAKAWLASHPTADWIADACSRALRDDDSYNSGEICVVEHESRLLFVSGPPTSGL